MRIKIIHKLIDIFRGKNNKGNDNKFIIETVKNKYIYSHFNRYIKIYGNNNRIICDCTKISKINKNLLNGLSINITGNNNVIYIEFPIRIKNVQIYMNRNNNKFSIKSTPNIFADAHFSIDNSSIVEIGRDSELGNGNLFVCCNNNFKNSHKLYIGDNVHIAKDVIIRTSDGQAILDYSTNEAINEPQDIIINNHCWVMTRCMIVKGAVLPPNTAVAPYSFVNKKFEKEYTLLGGIPANIIKENFKWDVHTYYEYKCKVQNKILETGMVVESNLPNSL